MADGKKVTDPELRQRIRARAEYVRQQILDKHGVVECAVDRRVGSAIANHWDGKMIDNFSRASRFR